MKLRYQFAITIALAALLGVGWLWLGGGQEDAGSKDGKSRGGGATRVLVENLSLATDRTMVRAVGTGAAHNSAAIHQSVSGEVVEANAALAESPGDVNLEPMGKGWFFKLTIADKSELDELMDEAGYATFLKSLG